MKLNVDEIFVDPTVNTREPFTGDECQSLAVSIANNGLIEPVVVIPYNGEPQYKYQLICGFRRYMAVAVILGHPVIEAHVKVGLTIDAAKHINLIENLERKDYSYYEECVALNRAFTPETSIEDIANVATRSRTWVRCRWLIWQLPESVIQDVREGHLGPTDIGIIVQKSPEEQIAAAKTLKDAEEAGNKDEATRKLTQRTRAVPKKEAKRVMSVLLSRNMVREMNAIRFAIGEISEEELFSLLG